MSRSYKLPYLVDSNSKKYGKKFANKRIRHLTGISNGANYKRHYPQYDICDFIIYIPEKAKYYRK